MTAVRNARSARGLARAAVLAVIAASPVAAASQTTTVTKAAPSSGVHFGQPGSPIDISAKSTQVFQQERRVVYQGEVEALQGTDRLRTPQLTIWYNNNAAKTAGAAAPAGGVGTLDRMEAEGPVYYVTATQSAKGDHGFYSAPDDTITLVGNVILTQDKNVSTGDKLVIHQKSGLADLTSENSGRRVRGVFYNDDKSKTDDKSKPVATASKPKPAH